MALGGGIRGRNHQASFPRRGAPLSDRTELSPSRGTKSIPCAKPVATVAGPASFNRCGQAAARRKISGHAAPRRVNCLNNIAQHPVYRVLVENSESAVREQIHFQ